MSLEEKIFNEVSASIEKGRAVLSSGMPELSSEETKELQKYFGILIAYLADLGKKTYNPDYNSIQEAKEKLEKPEAQ